MFKYDIKLEYKVESCASCPFRHEMIINEPVESMDKLSGITLIARRSSICVLKNEPVTQNEPVEGYNSKCPLKGNGIYVPDTPQGGNQ